MNYVTTFPKVGQMTSPELSGSVLPRSRHVALAAPRSFRAGVERAISIVEHVLDVHGPPMYVRRQIVHNVNEVTPQVHARAVAVVISTAGEVAGIEVADPRRVSYLTQTTLAVDETRRGRGRAHRPLRGREQSLGRGHLLRRDQPAGRRARPHSGRAVRPGARLVNPANSQHLVELAERLGVPARLIDGAADLRAEWLADVSTVGVTAGASAPPALVDEVVAALRRLGSVTVEERVTAVENIHFNPPAIGEPR